MVNIIKALRLVFWRTKKRLPLTASLTLLAGILNAQDVQQSIMNSQQAIQQSTLSSEINGLLLKGVTGAGTADADEKDFSYNPGMRIRNEVFTGISSRMKLSNSAALRSYDFNKAFTNLTADYRLRFDDAADIVTAYQTLNWQIVNSAPAVKPAVMAAARRQIAEVLSRNRDIYRNAGNRAMLGEEMKILFVMLHSAWNDAKKSGTTNGLSNRVAKQYKQQYGKDLRAMTLDARGLHEK